MADNKQRDKKRIKLKDLKPAEYNPRTITDEQLGRLKKALYEFGDLSGIVFNKKTDRLIGGHQRLKCLPPDAIIKKTKLTKPSRTGTVATGTIIIDNEAYIYREVDWDKTREKAANIAANQHGGEFNDDKLKELLEELSNIEGFDLDLTGFNRKDLNEFFNSPGELEEIIEDIKPYKMSHILISFPPEKLLDISKYLEKIFAIEGVEHEQSSN